MKYRITYPLYVWFASVLVGATLNYWGYLFFVNDLPVTNRRFMDALPTFPLSIMACILFSIPTFILLWLFIHVLVTWANLSTPRLRAWIALVAVILCASTFL